jgi:hypothetical protein
LRFLRAQAHAIAGDSILQYQTSFDSSAICRRNSR